MTATASETPSVNQQRLIVISNRLPVTIKENDTADDGGKMPWTYSMSSGGLVSALSGVKKLMSFLWIGWPGILSALLASRCHNQSAVGFEVNGKAERLRLSKELLQMHACYPVFLSNEIADLYYNGFSNRFSLSDKSLLIAELV